MKTYTCTGTPQIGRKLVWDDCAYRMSLALSEAIQATNDAKKKAGLLKTRLISNDR